MDDVIKLILYRNFPFFSQLKIFQKDIFCYKMNYFNISFGAQMIRTTCVYWYYVSSDENRSFLHKLFFCDNKY